MLMADDMPPVVTSSPFSQPVVFTLRVLLDLARYGSRQPLSFQVRSTFLRRRAVESRTHVNCQC